MVFKKYLNNKNHPVLTIIIKGKEFIKKVIFTFITTVAAIISMMVLVRVFKFFLLKI